jgi:two-component system alkaline phosphatase synthesis response regulator PhoP
MTKKIVLVEDEELIISLLQKKLNKEGYETLVARDGEEGLELIKKESPDLILLDIVMPKKGGFEVMEEIAKTEVLKNTPIIIISNSGQPVELGRAKKLGVKDWVIKVEFDPEEVVEKVKKQIGK